MRMLPFAAALIALPCACRRAPAEPTPTDRSAPRVEATARYRPPLDQSARRIATAAGDAGVTAASAVRSVSRLDVPAPDDIDVVAVRFEPPGRWVAAAVERDRVTPSLAGAERIYDQLVARGQSPTASQLTRIIGALYYYPWHVFDGTVWSTTPLTYDTIGTTSTPVFVELPNANGRALAFTYGIPDGEAGAGPHLGHFHVTDSGYLIDQAPNPWQR